MLLGDVVLTAIARVWQHRERIEWQAAAQFDRLAGELEAVRADPTVVGLARQAADDERVHAALCRKLVDQLDPRQKVGEMGRGGEGERMGARAPLGPPDLTRPERALYAAVAVSCVTETLSAALLLQIHRAAKDELVKSVVHHILKDEIDHSKLGWAHLASESRRTSVSWLAPHISGMIRDAVTTDLAPMSGPQADTAAFGVLGRREVGAIVDTTLSRVVFPGLARFGIHPRPASTPVA